MITTTDELKRMAIETAYSSKGHFKTADWMSWSLASYISVPLITSLLQALFAFPDIWNRILSMLGLLFSFFALSSVLAANQDKANRAIEEHMDLGNRYLEIYKEIRILLANIDAVTPDQLINLQRKISDLDKQTSRNRINFIGRWWTKLRIKEEMDLGWLIT